MGTGKRTELTVSNIDDCLNLQGDFEESDEQFRSRPRGGRKRKYPGVETLMRKRKRIVPPLPSDPISNQGSDYLQRLFSSLESEDEDEDDLYM